MFLGMASPLLNRVEVWVHMDHEVENEIQR